MKKTSKAFVSSISFENKPLPGGDAKPSAYSASKKLPSKNGGALRAAAYTPETVFKKS